jgi:outer membrane protein OmpA-like peptidoglycan-associated protein
MPKYGFDTYANPDMSTSDSKLELENINLAAAELGMKWAVSDRISLYTGVYFDYGLKSVTKKTTYDLLAYNVASPQAYQYNSILQSQQSTAGELFVDKVVPMAVGFKLRLSVGAGFAASKKTVKEESAPVVAKQEAVNAIQKNKNEALIEKQRIAEQRIADKRLAKQRVTQDQPIAEQRVTPEPQVMPEPQVTPNQRLAEQRIDGYLFKAIVLTDKQQAIMDRQIAFLKANPGLKITIEGYSCDLESDVFAQSRADYAKNYLVIQGISESRITTVNKGNCCPILPNTGELNRLLNRRIQIIIN